MGSRSEQDDQHPDVASAIAARGMRAFLEDHRADPTDEEGGTSEGRTSSTVPTEDQARAVLLARFVGDLEEVRRRPVRALAAWGRRAAAEEPRAGEVETREEVVPSAGPTEDDGRAALLARFAGDLEQVRDRPGRALAALEPVRGRADETEVRREPTVIPLPAVEATPPPPVVLRPAPPPAAREPAEEAGGRRGRRRALVAAAALLGTAAAVVLAVMIGTALRDVSSDEVDRETPAVATVAPPAGLPESGVLVESVVHDDGTQTVTEWVSSNRPISQLTLGAPSGPALDVEPEAVDVSVTAGGRKVPGDDVVGQQPSVYSLYEGSDVVKVTYTLDDSVQISPDADGRALVVASALRIGDAVTGPMRVRVTGGKVLSMACAARAGSTDPCGEPSGQGWQVLLSGDSRQDRVITQLDLG